MQDHGIKFRATPASGGGQTSDRHVVVDGAAGRRRWGEGVAGGPPVAVPFDGAAVGGERRGGWQEGAGGRSDLDVAAVGQRDGEPAFVNQAVVETAEQQQVIERGPAAVEPVFDVVAVDEAPVCAARKATSLVAQP